MCSFFNKAKEFVTGKIANLEKPEAELTDVSVKSINRDSVTFLSEVDITNPYSYSIPISDVSYTLKSAGRVIVSGTMKDPGSIKADTKTTVELPLKVPYDFLISILKDIGKDWDIDYELEVGLIIDLPVVGNFTIPLRKTGETKLPTFSDIFN